MRKVMVPGPRGARVIRDRVAVEEPLEIRLRFHREGKPVTAAFSITMRTPGNDTELAAGLLYAEGIVRTREEIKRLGALPELSRRHQSHGHAGNVVVVELDPGVGFDPGRMLRHQVTSSACGVCGKTTIRALKTRCPSLPGGEFLVSPRILGRLPGRLREAQTLFRVTGGAHGAALFLPDGTLALLREDVGRHNAVDKVVGHELLAGRLPLSGSILLVSGRASFEIVQKALMARIPFVAAVGAPSSMAVDLAQRFGMTLVGFLGEEKFNLYAGKDRVLLQAGRTGRRKR